ncbi:FAD-dependent oxidoreductase [Pseudorhodobacter sp.]|uniref:oxidoreductase n=1 Tax=Pseudorhodobacter sp. TaxID=1934400 RepID=UPI0039E69071
MSNDPLLQPYTLKHLTLRNRIMITSHEPAYPEDGMPKDRYRAYHVERAKAGVALTMTAGSASVSRDSPPVFNNILVWKDEVVGWMKQLADECHDHGAAVMIQLSHLGRRTRWDKGDWLPSVSTSHVREPAHRAYPKQVEDWDISRIIKDYADGAERMHAAGLDGVELECYGHLMDQFMSSFTNRLDGPYGGSLQNRARFALDVVAAIRERVGEKFLIGVRYTADEAAKGGIDAEEGVAIGKLLRDSGNVDFLNIIRGQIHTDPAMTDVIPIMGMKSAPHLDFAGRIRAEVGLPTFHAARIPDVATARHAIASGKLDMVGMTRAHMTDPHLVRKIIEGREDDIRPCVGANYCLDRIYQGGHAYCIHNPSTGRELEQPHDIAKAQTPKKILIIGAGPAGLEAARVAALRGHRVVVHEAAAHAGGQIRLTAQTARRREMIGIIDWRLAQCEKLGVSIKYNSLADEATVTDEAPDVVIIATGGLPETAILDAGNELVTSAWDILSGDVRPGSNVLLYDEAGDPAGLQAADKVVEAGGKVEIMTRDRSFAPEVMAMNLVPYMRTLQRADATFTITWRVLSVRREGNGLVATVGSDYGDMTRERRVDQVIVNNATVPLDELYFALKPLSTNLGEVDYAAFIASTPQSAGPNPADPNRKGAFHLYRIGDAVSSRNTHAAIYDALRLMRTI